MGVVDFEFYSGVYMGKVADETSFTALCARASDVIGALTRWADETKILSLPARIDEQPPSSSVCKIAHARGPYASGYPGRIAGKSLCAFSL